MNYPVIPLEKIGENNWIKKLTKFLDEYDVEVKGLNFETKINLPKQVDDYYKYFGGINSHDFMYSLYKPMDFTNLNNSEWSFLKDLYDTNELENYLVFSESPSNDPLCFDLKDFSIYLFTHDPLKKIKVFNDFNQYLRYEIIELQKLMGYVDLSKEEEISLQKKILKCDDTDYNLRYQLLC